MSSVDGELTRRIPLLVLPKCSLARPRVASSVLQEMVAFLAVVLWMCLQVDVAPQRLIARNVAAMLAIDGRIIVTLATSAAVHRRRLVEIEWWRITRHAFVPDLSSN